MSAPTGGALAGAAGSAAARPDAAETSVTAAPPVAAAAEARLQPRARGAQPSPADANQPRQPAQQRAPPRYHHGRGDGEPRGKLRPVCKFYGTKKGCRAGRACPFSHTEAQAAVVAGETTPAQAVEQRNYQAPSVPASKVTTKPISALQSSDPREFQLQQLRRRFSPSEEITSEATTLSFKLVPSDPDFPYELTSMNCVLRVPVDYPIQYVSATPTLRVTNAEMERGFQANVERGFDELVQSRAKDQTLLSLINALDRRLEALLAGRKAETVKLIANAGSPASRPSTTAPSAAANSAKARDQDLELHPPGQSTPPTHSPEHSAIAKARRDAETRQLEARLGRLPNFSKSADGIAYTVPVALARKADLPVPLQAVSTVLLLVPRLYPLLPCRMQLQGISRDAAWPTEQAFEQHARETPQMSLTGHMNYLGTNMHMLAEQGAAMEEEEEEEVLRAQLEATQIDDDEHASAEWNQEHMNKEQRSHVRVIPRPPEWNYGGTEIVDLQSDSDITEDDSEDNLEIEPDSSQAQGGGSTTERGIAVSFPSMELHGIELLELAVLSLTVKCERCKHIMDVHNLRHISGVPRSESCKKCASALQIGFRHQLMHANSIRAGYLDLEGCMVVDMLPSSFIPTCSECSTAFPSPGCAAVRGDSVVAACRQCHHKMNFRLPELKFLVVSAIAKRSVAPRPRKARENLGIVAGQALPRNGRCEHYRKSYRWFRFSCCARVYACDRCHDAKEQHPNEHAARMICGFCSREQHYRPSDCARCGAELVAGKASGFWEGGKGTRDPVKMSRKDPRKYKRRGGGSGH